MSLGSRDTSSSPVSSLVRYKVCNWRPLKSRIQSHKYINTKPINSTKFIGGKSCSSYWNIFFRIYLAHFSCGQSLVILRVWLSPQLNYLYFSLPDGWKLFIEPGGEVIRLWYVLFWAEEVHPFCRFFQNYGKNCTFNIIYRKIKKDLLKKIYWSPIINCLWVHKLQKKYELWFLNGSSWRVPKLHPPTFLLQMITNIKFI